MGVLRTNRMMLKKLRDAVRALGVELFARGVREGWDMWGNQATEDYEPTWDTYSNHTVASVKWLGVSYNELG